MTGTQLKEFLENIVDDSIDSTLFITLVNMAKTEIEGERDWEQIKDVDESNSSSASNTYLTANTLPTRFLSPVMLYLGTDRIPYKQIPFQERERYRDVSHRYYIKLKDDQYFVCGTPLSGQTHHFFHTKRSTDLATGTMDSWSWEFPDAYHPLLGIKMAKIYYPINTGEKIRAWDDRWLVQENLLRRLMIQWDNKLKRDADRHARLGIDPSSHPNIAGSDGILI